MPIPLQTKALCKKYTKDANFNTLCYMTTIELPSGAILDFKNNRLTLKVDAPVRKAKPVNIYVCRVGKDQQLQCSGWSM